MKIGSAETVTCLMLHLTLVASTVYSVGRVGHISTGQVAREAVWYDRMIGVLLCMYNVYEL